MDDRQQQMEALRRQLGLDKEGEAEKVSPTVPRKDDDVNSLVSSETKENLAKAKETAKEGVLKAWSLTKEASAKAKEKANALAEKKKSFDLERRLKAEASQTQAPSSAIAERPSQSVEPHPERKNIGLAVITHAPRKWNGRHILYIAIGGAVVIGLAVVVGVVLSNRTPEPAVVVETPARPETLASPSMTPQPVVETVLPEVKEPVSLVEEVKVEAEHTKKEMVEEVERAPIKQEAPAPKKEVAVASGGSSVASKPKPQTKPKRKPAPEPTQEKSWQDKANDDIDAWLERQQ